MLLRFTSLARAMVSILALVGTVSTSANASAEFRTHEERAAAVPQTLPLQSGYRVQVSSDALLPARLSGCRAWAPVFRPILAVLGAGQIQVALPSFVPRFAQRVYPHASVLQPPKTYHVTLTTSPLDRPGAGRTLLRIDGNAGNHVSALGRGIVIRTRHKTLHLHSVSGGPSSIVWFRKAGGITYTVSATPVLPIATLLRVAKSLTPGILRRTTITNGPAPQTPPCP